MGGEFWHAQKEILLVLLDIFTPETKQQAAMPHGADRILDRGARLFPNFTMQCLLGLFACFHTTTGGQPDMFAGIWHKQANQQQSIAGLTQDECAHGVADYYIGHLGKTTQFFLQGIDQAAGYPYLERKFGIVTHQGIFFFQVIQRIQT